MEAAGGACALGWREFHRRRGWRGRRIAKRAQTRKEQTLWRRACGGLRGRGEWPAALFFGGGGFGLDGRRSEVRKSQTFPCTRPRLPAHHPLPGRTPRPSPDPTRRHPRQRGLAGRCSHLRVRGDPRPGCASRSGPVCRASGLNSRTVVEGWGWVSGRGWNFASAPGWPHNKFGPGFCPPEPQFYLQRGIDDGTYRAVERIKRDRDASKLFAYTHRSWHVISA